MDIAKMMQQAQKMQEQMQTVQAELAAKTVEATVGGGRVTVTATGAGDVVALKIAPEVLNPGDVEMVEDLILSGIKQAIEKGRQLQADEMSKVTAGLGLPPGLGL